MPFSDFKLIKDVTKKFNINRDGTPFISIDNLNVKISDYILSDLTERLNDPLNYYNETTICERIISLILYQIDKLYPSLRVWSHITYEVDKNKGLSGEPDYLVAPATKDWEMGIPPICIMEAKKENWEEGWAQTLAEMYAAFIQGANICYGIVTTGRVWQFGKLEKGKTFTLDPHQISATRELQEVFNILNWLFAQAGGENENND